MADELTGYLAEQQQLAVAPTVTALRARANQVIEAELVRLSARLPEADDVASMVEYLLGDGGRNITGTVLTVDAGNTA